MAARRFGVMPFLDLSRQGMTPTIAARITAPKLEKVRPVFSHNVHPIGIDFCRVGEIGHSDHILTRRKDTAASPERELRHQ
jgi:hypothetical protein